jgi:hypothetical protein
MAVISENVGVRRAERLWKEEEAGTFDVKRRSSFLPRRCDGNLG